MCLFVPGTGNRQQWSFGVTVGPLMLGDTKGAVILEHGNLRTYSKRDLHEGFKRVQDRSRVVGKPWFPANVYCVEYKERGMAQILDDLFDAFKAQSAETQQSDLQESERSYEDALARKRDVRKPASSVVRPVKVAPKQDAPIFLSPQTGNRSAGPTLSPGWHPTLLYQSADGETPRSSVSEVARWVLAHSSPCDPPLPVPLLPPPPPRVPSQPMPLVPAPPPLPVPLPSPPHSRHHASACLFPVGDSHPQRLASP